MSVVLATLCLNEMEWLPRLYQQHKGWPELERWVFVEAADRAYARSNPELVTEQGLSIDGTSEFLSCLGERDPRVTYIAHGFTETTGNPELGKIAARQRYLDVANKVKPEFVICLDADEFYTQAHQALCLEAMRRDRSYWCWTFPKREIWRPPYLQKEGTPLLKYEAIGGFWGIPCCHWWRWMPEMGYTGCHNIPSNHRGVYLNDRLAQRHEDKFWESTPHMVHMGFASQRHTRLAKNSYYATRGESVDPQRAWYVQSRAAWDNWSPGVKLPRHARVAVYDGPVPEVFQ